MADYYVNNEAQANGDHEVHQAGCPWMPGNKKYLGDHSTCHTAVAEAKKNYRTADGCKHCSFDCHRQ